MGRIFCTILELYWNNIRTSLENSGSDFCSLLELDQWKKVRKHFQHICTTTTSGASRKLLALLSSPRFVFPIGFSLYLTLFPQQLPQSRSLFILCSWLPSTRVNCIIIILY